MLSLQEWQSKPEPQQPAGVPQSQPRASGEVAQFAPQPRLSHRTLPGGGRLFVTLTDGTPVGMIRYDIEKCEDALPLLLRAFASIVEERVNRAEPST